MRRIFAIVTQICRLRLAEGCNPMDNFTLVCPIPISEYPAVLLAHGGGQFQGIARSARHQIQISEWRTLEN